MHCDSRLSSAPAAYDECGKCAHDRPKGVVDTTGAAGRLKRLASAPTEADLVKTLKGKGPCTMFAPTDKAFAKLPKATVVQLLGPEIRESLTAILAYHVVPGKVMAADVVVSQEGQDDPGVGAGSPCRRGQGLS